MKAYFSTIIPKIQQFSKKLNTEALLQNKKWHIFNEEGKDLIYIFRSNNELLVSEEGKVTKGKWEFITNDTILIDYSDGSFLFNPAFMDDVVLSLKLEGKTDYVFMLDRVKLEKKIGSIGELNSYLEERYLVEKSNEKVVNEKYDYQKVNIGKPSNGYTFSMILLVIGALLSFIGVIENDSVILLLGLGSVFIGIIGIITSKK